MKIPVVSQRERVLGQGELEQVAARDEKPA
jgi:hypothetical protein